MSKSIVVEKKYLLPFILVTSLFFLWGVPNDLTNPMVEVFKNVLDISNSKASLVQFAFYGGYGTMAIPAALFIRKYRYSTGILIGLGLFFAGSILMYPATQLTNYNFVLVSLYVLTFGLAFLETTANPMVLAMGDPKTATLRLNLAQAFNPMGALTGQFIAKALVKDKLYTQMDGTLSEASSSLAKEDVIFHDMNVVSYPYILVGFIVLAIFVMFVLKKVDVQKNAEEALDMSATLKKLFSNKNYYEGVITQFFYVACQIMVWTYIYQYVTALNVTRSPENQLDATVYVYASTICFLSARWICTFLMRYISSAKLMLIMALLGSTFMTYAIISDTILGLYSLVAVSFCMSLMFPTIYGLALQNMGDEAKLGSAGLILGIVGGAVMPLFQGMVIDVGGKGLSDSLFFGFIPEIRFSFVIPLFCLVIVAIYCLRTLKRSKA